MDIGKYYKIGLHVRKFVEEVHKHNNEFVQHRQEKGNLVRVQKKLLKIVIHYLVICMQYNNLTYK